MKKLMTIAAAALAIAAFAQEPGEGPRGGQRPGGHGPQMGMRGGMMPGGMGGDQSVMAVMNPKIAEKIGLSEEVRNQIKELDKASREAMKDLQQKTRAAMDKQAELMKAEKVDEAAVMAAIDEVFEIRKAMAKSQMKRVLSVKALLTPEQIKAAVEAMKEMREMRRGGDRAERGGEHGVRGPKGGRRGPKGEGDKGKDDQPPPPEEK